MKAPAFREKADTHERIIAAVCEYGVGEESQEVSRGKEEILQDRGPNLACTRQLPANWFAALLPLGRAGHPGRGSCGPHSCEKRAWAPLLARAIKCVGEVQMPCQKCPD